MRWFLKATCATLAMLVWACSTSTSQDPGPSHPTLKLSEILRHPNPKRLYQQVFRAFRFSSTSTLLTPPSSGEPIQGKTFLEMDASGNYHLTRVAIAGHPSVELYHSERKAYLRTGNDQPFRITPHQPEFDRWINQSFREVLSLFAAGGFSENLPASETEGLLCRRHEGATLCSDPASQLPVKGSIIATSPEGPQVEVRFSLAPERERPVKIDRPPVSGSSP